MSTRIISVTLVSAALLDEKVLSQMRRAVAICSSSGANCPASPSQP